MSLWQLARFSLLAASKGARLICSVSKRQVNSHRFPEHSFNWLWTRSKTFANDEQRKRTVTELSFSLFRHFQKIAKSRFLLIFA